MTILDPTEEIKAIRHRLGAEMDFDVSRIVAETRRRQAESNREFIRFQPRRTANNNRIHQSGEVEPSDVENLSSPPGDA